MEPYGSSIAALADGGAVVTDAADVGGYAYQVVRLDGSGAVTLSVGRFARTDAADIAVLADGAFVLAQTDPGQVLRMETDGRFAVLAGGRGHFVEGGKAIGTDLGQVSAVSVQPDGALLLGTDRGLLRLDPDGSIHTLVAAGAANRVAANDAREVSSDGSAVAGVRLMGITRVATLSGTAEPLVLTSVPGQTARLALISTPQESGRFALALPPRNRTSLQHGSVEIIATRPATGRVEVLHGRRVLAARRVTLARGRTRIRLAMPATTTPAILRVTATTGDGAIASHQLTVMMDRTLGRTLIRRLEEAISLLSVDIESDAIVNCRRKTPRRFACTTKWFTPEEDGTTGGVLKLRPDGLIGYQERFRGHAPFTLVFEPLTFNPRSSERPADSESG
jgi:hypothetical protein